ncbi:MAG: polysaccharide deacetylase family protein [Lachnospiraceae bacterium]|nr:polysaccharide deacetylase family protein [Lachnospiraceae bacterium]
MAKRTYKKRKNNHKRIILGVIAIAVVLFGCWQARNAYIKAKGTRAAEERINESPTTEEVKKNCWEKKDGKSYYYGEDGEILTGRFVLQDEKKIYYTDDDGAVVRTVDGTKPMISITYDDGPSQFSSDFAALFDQYDSAATFFEVGNRIKEIPSLEKQEQAIADSNSELANHTYNHKNLTLLSKENMLEQIHKNEEVLRSFGETADPIMFRVPEGAVNSVVKENCGVPIILWSIDTMDWKSRNANSVYKIAREAQDGDIILMHSLYQSTLNASKKLVPELIDQGYQLVTVTDLAEFRGGFENGEKYFSFPPIEADEEEGTADTAEE